MNRLIALLEFLPRQIGIIGAWIIAPLVISMVWEVVARHFFNAPTIWAYEVGYMLAGASYMFGIAYCLQLDGHIRVDFIYDNVGPKIQAFIDLLGYVVLLLPGAIWLTYGLGEYTYEAIRDGEVSGESAWNPVVWPFRVTWFLGFFVFCLQIIAEMLKCVRVFLGGERHISAEEGINL